MTYQPLLTNIGFPGFAAMEGTSPLNASVVQGSNTSTSTKVASVFAIPKSGTLSGLSFSVGTLTTAATINIRLETINTSTGFPSGTLYDANATASQASPAASTTYSVSFAGTFSVTEGDLVALVYSSSSGSPNYTIVTGAQFANASITRGSFFRCIPNQTYNGSAWTQATTTGIASCALLYSGDTYYTHGSSTLLASTWSTSNAGSLASTQRGYKFNFPYGVRVTGCLFVVDQDAGGLVNLYDSSLSTALATGTYYTNLPAVATAQPNWVRFASPVDIAANTDFYLVINGNGSASPVLRLVTPGSNSGLSYLNFLTLPDSQIVVARPGTVGTLTPSSTADWTEDTSGVFPVVAAMVSAIDIPSGGGGGGVPFSAAW